MKQNKQYEATAKNWNYFLRSNANISKVVKDLEKRNVAFAIAENPGTRARVWITFQTRRSRHKVAEMFGKQTDKVYPVLEERGLLETFRESNTVIIGKDFPSIVFDL